MSTVLLLAPRQSRARMPGDTFCSLVTKEADHAETQRPQMHHDMPAGKATTPIEVGHHSASGNALTLDDSEKLTTLRLCVSLFPVDVSRGFGAYHCRGAVGAWMEPRPRANS